MYTKIKHLKEIPIDDVLFEILFQEIVNHPATNLRVYITQLELLKVMKPLGW
jgi:hypothetical protein